MDASIFVMFDFGINLMGATCRCGELKNFEKLMITFSKIPPNTLLCFNLTMTLGMNLGRSWGVHLIPATRPYIYTWAVVFSEFLPFAQKNSLSSSSFSLTKHP